MTATTAVPLLREVRLYGHLGREFGRVHRLAVRTAQEAAFALCAVLPGFERAFLGRDGRAAYHVFVGSRAQRRDIGVDELAAPLGAVEPIRFVPVVAGAKRSGGLQVVLGYVLTWVGYALYASGYGAALGAAVQSIGYSMIVGGVIQMLSPQRTNKTVAADNKPSYAFDGPVNNAEQGGPVPFIAGRVFCGSTVVSQGLSSDELVTPLASAPAPDPVTLPDYEPQYPGGPNNSDGGSGE